MAAKQFFQEAAPGPLDPCGTGTQVLVCRGSLRASSVR